MEEADEEEGEEDKDGTTSKIQAGPKKNKSNDQQPKKMMNDKEAEQGIAEFMEKVTIYLFRLLTFSLVKPPLLCLKSS